jgi:hypothetical protein
MIVRVEVYAVRQAERRVNEILVSFTVLLHPTEQPTSCALDRQEAALLGVIRVLSCHRAFTRE